MHLKKKTDQQKIRFETCAFKQEMKHNLIPIIYQAYAATEHAIVYFNSCFPFFSNVLKFDNLVKLYKYA
ncbi:hypothetical protein T4A_5569 [Trichinella pseudospiralis]|nr:hypothetical protein T4A_5569 [Trichinella pseudospiralis]